MPKILAGYRGPLVVVGLGAGFAAVGAVPVVITFSIGIRTSATIIGMGFVGFGILLMTPGLIWCLVVWTQRGFRTWMRKRTKNGGGLNGVCPSDGVTSSPAPVTSKSERRPGHVTSDDELVGGTHFGSLSKNPDVEDEDDDNEETPALSGCDACTTSDRRYGDQQHPGNTSTSTSTHQQQRPRCWPPTYVDPPPLIITDHSVRRATTPTPVVDIANVAVATTLAHDDEHVRIFVDPPSNAAADEDSDDAIVDLSNCSCDVSITMTTADDDDSLQLLKSSPVNDSNCIGTVPSGSGGVNGPLGRDILL